MKTIQIATITGLIAVFALAIAPSLVEDAYARGETIDFISAEEIDIISADFEEIELMDSGHFTHFEEIELVDSTTTFDYVVDPDMNLVDATTFEYVVDPDMNLVDTSSNSEIPQWIK